MGGGGVAVSVGGEEGLVVEQKGLDLAGGVGESAGGLVGVGDGDEFVGVVGHDTLEGIEGVGDAVLITEGLGLGDELGGGERFVEVSALGVGCRGDEQREEGEGEDGETMRGELGWEVAGDSARGGVAH